MYHSRTVNFIRICCFTEVLKHGMNYLVHSAFFAEVFQFSDVRNYNWIADVIISEEWFDLNNLSEDQLGTLVHGVQKLISEVLHFSSAKSCKSYNFSDLDSDDFWKINRHFYQLEEQRHQVGQESWKNRRGNHPVEVETNQKGNQRTRLFNLRRRIRNNSENEYLEIVPN